MGKQSKKTTGGSDESMRPALNPESQENRMISLAINLAEKQLREGTASAQVITHYLRLGTTQARLEKEKLKKETELLQAKTRAYATAESSEKLYSEALAAFRVYTGQGGPENEELSDIDTP